MSNRPGRAGYRSWREDMPNYQPFVHTPVRIDRTQPGAVRRFVIALLLVAAVLVLWFVCAMR